MDDELKSLAEQLQLHLLQVRLQVQRAAQRGEAPRAAVHAVVVEARALLALTEAVTASMAKGG